MRVQSQRRIQIEDLITLALSEHLLKAYYQPIIDLRSDTIVGTEALARIHQRDGRVIGPGDFIAVAESSGLIVPLGETMLNLACTQQARWQIDGNTRNHVSVNVSARQLASTTFVNFVAKTLTASHLRPEAVCIELTEPTLIEIGSSRQSSLHELKDLGVSLAIDDFGTGWSSLSYLRRFPIDIVKIDRSFVAGLGANDDDTALTQAVIDLTQALHMTTIAEGVETEQQDQLLRQMGCDQAQGYLYGHPRPTD